MTGLVNMDVSFAPRTAAATRPAKKVSIEIAGRGLGSGLGSGRWRVVHAAKSGDPQPSHIAFPNRQPATSQGMQTLRLTEQFKTLFDRGPSRISPFFITQMVVDMPAGVVAMLKS